MLSRIAGRTIAEEARKPTLDVVMRATDRRWNWLGHIRRLEQHRIIRQVLLSCVRPTPDSRSGDVPGLDSKKASEIAMAEKRGNAVGLHCIANLLKGNCCNRTFKPLNVSSHWSHAIIQLDAQLPNCRLLRSQLRVFCTPSVLLSRTPFVRHCRSNCLFP